MTVDTKKLRELAEAATPGPWRWGDWNATFGTVENPERMLRLERNLTRLDDPAPYKCTRADGRYEVLPALEEPASGNTTANAAFIAAANPQTVIALLDEVELLRGYSDAALAQQLAAANAEIERLRGQLVGAEAANAVTASSLVEHSELTAHIDIVEQCRDYLAHEIVDEGDPSGKLQDFADSLRAVIDQLDLQRRSRNWYEAAYQAGKQKLVESCVAWMRPVYDAAVALRMVTKQAENARTPAECNQRIIDNANAFRVLFDAVDAAELQKVGQ